METTCYVHANRFIAIVRGLFAYIVYDFDDGSLGNSLATYARSTSTNLYLFTRNFKRVTSPKLPQGG